MDDFDFVVGRVLDPFRAEGPSGAHVAKLDDGVREPMGGGDHTTSGLITAKTKDKTRNRCRLFWDGWSDVGG